MTTLPTAFISGYELLASGDTAPSQGLFIPLTSLPALTAAEANEVTGDGRKICYELIREILSQYTAMSVKPARMAITVGTPTGINASTVRRSYTLAFDLDVSDADVAAES